MVVPLPDGAGVRVSRLVAKPFAKCCSHRTPRRWLTTCRSELKALTRASPAPSLGEMDVRGMAVRRQRSVGPRQVLLGERNRWRGARLVERKTRTVISYLDCSVFDADSQTGEIPGKKASCS